MMYTPTGSSFFNDKTEMFLRIKRPLKSYTFTFLLSLSIVDIAVETSHVAV